LSEHDLTVEVGGDVAVESIRVEHGRDEVSQDEFLHTGPACHLAHLIGRRMDGRCPVDEPVIGSRALSEQPFE
jgi:hypothetical protein